MDENWQPLGKVANEVVIETDAHRRLSQQDFEWLTIEQRAILYGEFKDYGAEHGYKPGWAAMKYKDRFGEWPNRNVEATPRIPCSPETRLWIKATMQDLWRTRKRRPKP